MFLVNAGPKGRDALRQNLNLFAPEKDYVRPPSQCYNVVVNARQKMKYQCSRLCGGHLTSSLAQPNSRSYNAVIHALQNSNGSAA